MKPNQTLASGTHLRVVKQPGSSDTHHGSSTYYPVRYRIEHHYRDVYLNHYGAGDYTLNELTGRQPKAVVDALIKRMRELDAKWPALVEAKKAADAEKQRKEEEDRKANQRLAQIQKAGPELLEALRVMVERSERTGREENKLDKALADKARAAIAKAEGSGA